MPNFGGVTIICPTKRSSSMEKTDEWPMGLRKRETARPEGTIHLDFVLGEDTISHVGIRERSIVVSGSKVKVGSIGGVATKEEYRSRGLATCLMKRAMERIESDDGDIMFVSGDRGLYRRLGCNDASEFYRAIVDRGVAESPSPTKTVIAMADQEDVPALASLYDEEPVRWERFPEEFSRLLAGNAVPLWRPVEPFLILQGGRCTAYLMIQKPDESKREEEGCVYASEYAGSRAAILGSANRLLEEAGAKRIVFHVPGHDRELLAEFREMGVRLESETLPGHTFKILNPVRLMDRLRPYIEERLGPSLAADLSWHQEGGRFRLQLHGESIAFNGDLERLVLGPHSKLKLGSGTRLPRFISSLFPVPFPWPGLNGF